ncbi:type II secretion system protein GspD [Pectobacterium parmentieri]|uniref:Phage like secreted protein n=1 Tax=Pectobacterium parmentieri TaxID=1905730 RepID=A0A0H3I6G6_PECPM|nr:phage like secreted protein [Pectobacterium parmentieri]AFI90398.1 Phage like secreted protein [Pectobacterium parmentieri]MBI0473447.1 type II secretion system protein GspD [Pectobacterium parmentieri]MBI0496072.1 type II secretion system protein GspD [Pectobacterium parmentieri]MBI0557467.1 type II secretion system protein GspD [Pectobacterium parmentieri]MBI0570608.1 type II secretion system protein GspD [Pectobacterium parmentieri]
MKKYVFPLLLAFSPQSHAAGSGVDFELKSVTVPDALSIFYTQILKKPFRLSPDVVGMPEKISFRLMPEQDARQFLIDYMGDIGVVVKTKSGADFFYKPIQVEKKTPQFSYVYRPLYRSPEYLAAQLKTLVDDAARFAQGEGINSDSLVFYGSRADIRRISDVLPQLDTQADEVLVSGYVYEIQANSRDGSGLQLAASLLNTKLNFQIGGNSRGYENFLKISTGSLNAMVELFKTDNRFHVVSSPTLRARSGADARFSVGSSTPTLGNVSYQGQSAVQSVVYRDSGIIFSVSPTIRKNVIDLEISQEMSNFTATDNGVNSSPTLIKREISTSISLQDGEIILLGGLAEQKNNDSKMGFSLLPLFASEGSDSSKTDIVVVLQVRKIR